MAGECVKGKSLIRLMQEIEDKKEKYLELPVDLRLEAQVRTWPMLDKLGDSGFETSGIMIAQDGAASLPH